MRWEGGGREAAPTHTLYVAVTDDDFTISRLCEATGGIAPGAPIGGCDPPHAVSIAMQTVTA